MMDDYAGYNALALQPGVEQLAHMTHARRKFVEAQKVQLKGKTERADVALTMISELYGIERELKDVSDDQRFSGRTLRWHDTSAVLHAGGAATSFSRRPYATSMLVFLRKNFQLWRLYRVAVTIRSHSLQV